MRLPSAIREGGKQREKKRAGEEEEEEERPLRHMVTLSEAWIQLYRKPIFWTSCFMNK